MDIVLLPVTITSEVAERIEPIDLLVKPCKVGLEHPATFRRGFYRDHVLIAIGHFCTSCQQLVEKWNIRPLTDEELEDEWYDTT